MTAMLKQYSPLVKRLAHQMMARLPASVEVDDLIQVGMIGLMESLNRFDPAQGVQLETFASQRIRGAMLDELRSNDHLSRGTRRQQRAIEDAIQMLEQKLGQAPSESEIAVAMGLSLSDYQEALDRVRGGQLMYIEDLAGEDGGTHFLERHMSVDAPDQDPLARLLDRSRREELVQAIEALPERDKQVMGMYYEHDMNLKEIGAVLGVTESRVSQIHSQCIARLRAKLRG